MSKTLVRHAETGLQAHRRKKHQRQKDQLTPDITRWLKDIKNRNQGDITLSKPNSLTIASPGQPNTPEKQDLDLKSHLIMVIEGFNKDIHTSLNKYRRTL